MTTQTEDTTLDIEQPDSDVEILQESEESLLSELHEVVSEKSKSDLSRVLQSLTELNDQLSDLHLRVDQMTDLMANPPSTEVPLAMATTTVQLPSIPVTLNDVTISSLLDTGFPLSLITSDVFSKFGFHISPNSKTHSGMGVSATPFVIKAYLDLLFHIGDKNYTVRTGVTDTLPNSVLLCYDFYKKYSVSINSNEKFANVAGNRIPLLEPRTNQTLLKGVSVLRVASGPTCSRISVLNDITVAPLTRVIAPAYIAHGKSLPTEVLFEPNKIFCRDKLVSSMQHNRTHRTDFSGVNRQCDEGTCRNSSR